jgi:hypothetical protein
VAKYLTLAGSVFQEVEDNRLLLSAVTNLTSALTPLTLPDGSPITIPNNTAIAYNILVGARATSGTNIGKVAFYQQSGNAKNINNTSSLLSSATVQGEDVNSWNFTTIVSNNNLVFQVSGDLQTVVSWKAIAQLIYI